MVPHFRGTRHQDSTLCCTVQEQLAQIGKVTSTVGKEGIQNYGTTRFRWWISLGDSACFVVSSETLSIRPGASRIPSAVFRGTVFFNVHTSRLSSALFPFKVASKHGEHRDTDTFYPRAWTLEQECGNLLKQTSIKFDRQQLRSWGCRLPRITK